MKSSYKRLGNYIEAVNRRNIDGKVTDLRGLSLTKEFRNSTSNIVGTDMTTYKIMHKYDFAANFMGLGVLVDKAAIVLKTDDEPNIVSGAYPVFRVQDEAKLHPQYLMMWLIRSEFDRFCVFKSDRGIRGGFDWSDLLEVQLPIPNIAKQLEIVKEYNTIQNRIALNHQLIQKLEETAQAIYKIFLDRNLHTDTETLADYIESANTGLDAIKRAPIVFEDTGIKCLRIQNVSNNSNFDSWGFTEVDNANFKKFQLKRYDILVARTGATVGGNIFIRKDLSAVFNNGLIRIRADRSKLHPIFLQLFFKTDLFVEHINSIAFGTSTQPNIQIGELLSFPVSFPPIEIQKEFTDQLIKIDNLIFNLTEQVSSLERLKELILSKLATIEN